MIVSDTLKAAPRKQRVKKIDEVSEQIARYQWIRDITDDAIKKRSTASEFHGLEQELREMQLALLDSYNKTKPIKHPRDKGDQREEILRRFLTTHGLIPRKYGVTTVSTRAVSTTGHISPELDIVFYDGLETIVLKRFAGTLDYLPIESVHGTIQVKSRLTKQELRSGLKNIRDFKTLDPENLQQKVGGFTIETGLYPRFGILFAYEYDLDWASICEELRLAAQEHGTRLLPNAVFILNKGHFFFGDEEKGSVLQSHLQNIDVAKVYGFPDHDGSNLVAFYSILTLLLGDTVAGRPRIGGYLRLPLTVGRYSYSYSHGAISEVDNCPVHGKFLKTITLQNIEKIIKTAQGSTPVNWIRALDIADGQAGDNYDRYEKQPAEVRIYNPNDISLSDILKNKNGFLTFESIEVENMTVWLPWHYIDQDNLIDSCPKCSKMTRKSQQLV